MVAFLVVGFFAVDLPVLAFLAGAFFVAGSLSALALLDFFTAAFLVDDFFAGASLAAFSFSKVMASSKLSSSGVTLFWQCGADFCMLYIRAVTTGIHFHTAFTAWVWA